MSSEDIVRQIIRKIVSASTEYFRKTKKENEVILENQNIDFKLPIKNDVTPTIDNPLTSIPGGVSRLFASGIHSHLKLPEVTDTLAAFMIRAVVLDPTNRFQIDKEMPQTEVDRLISICIHKIISMDNPGMNIIRTQVYFDSDFPSQVDFLKKEKNVRIEQCSSLIREIFDVKSKNMSVFESLNRKIVSYILLKSNVGNHLDLGVIREATAALESVFPNSELSTFISLTRSEKENQLTGLTNLVTGIRLFNKHLEKGGETIEQLPDYCNMEWRELSLLLRDQMRTTEQDIQQFKAILDYAKYTKNSEVSPELQEKIRIGLIFKRQYLIYLDALQDQVDNSKQLLESLTKKYDSTMSDLKFSCKSKTAVPVDQVYPLFISLANYWFSWTDELFLLAFRRGIMETLIKFANNMIIEIPQLIDSLSDKYKTDIDPEIMDEHQVIQLATGTMTALGMINKNVEVVHPGNTTQYYKLPVEFGGFCPYSLVECNGLVVPGDKNIGMIRYKDRLFAFATVAYAVEFARSPDMFVEKVILLSKREPYYVQLLHLYKFFPTVDTLEKAQSYTRQKLLGQIPIVSEVGCQVDTHITDYDIKPNYSWNEWDLRRQALMLVNLKDKLTHSTQTNASHFRRDSETQHYEPKTQNTQTKKSSHTSVPRTTHFLSGLRNSGVPITKGIYQKTIDKRKHHFKVVDITIDREGGPNPYGGGAYGLPPLIKTPKRID